MASAIPEDQFELLTLRSAIQALEDGGRVEAAETLALNPQAPPSQRFNGGSLYTWAHLRRWADTLYGEPEREPVPEAWERLTTLETPARP